MDLYYYSDNGYSGDILDTNLLVNYTYGWYVTLDAPASITTPNACYHYHVYNFVYDNIRISGNTDSVTSLDVFKWPVIGVPYVYCAIDVTTLNEGTLLAAGED